MPTMFLPTFVQWGFKVLADDFESQAYSGILDTGIHLPSEWFDSLVKFIATILPLWRDDPLRPSQTGETKLTAQLCSRLTSASHHTPGWDFLQFKREEPDEADGRRSIDLTVAPCGHVIWIKGRTYTEYQTLFPIECKRLPTPVQKDRDAREYLYSQFNSTGGIQRFKAGHHASEHARAAMIGYVQASNITKWAEHIDKWIEELENQALDGWSPADKLTLIEHNTIDKTATFQSLHMRRLGLDQIKIDHLWIEM